jgi:hypothetical protein
LAVGERDELAVASRTFDQGRDPGRLFAQEEVPLPVAGDGTVFDLRGTLGDHDAAGDLSLSLALRALSLGVAGVPAASKAGRELAPQRAAALDEQRQVDRLVGDLHVRITRVGAAQPPRDLLGRPLTAELLLDNRPQLGVEVKLCGLRPSGPVPGGLIGLLGAVAVAAPVSVHLSRDRRVIATDSPRDRVEALAAGEAAGDLLPLPL